MPSRYSVKTYLSNGYYHIYNRGVEKRTIFVDQQDYRVFLDYLKTYLLPKDEDALEEILADKEKSWAEKDKALKLLRLNNFYNKIDLLSFCLMPNHFHFLVKQDEHNTIDMFMNSLSTRYVMYFNRKHKRVGPLFQDVYKAVLVESDEQLLYLTAYIHRNPFSRYQLLQGDVLQNALQKEEGQPSSLSHYLGLQKLEWVREKEILAHFSTKHRTLSYEAFVRQTDDFSPVGQLLFEDE